jgi:putative transposase
MWDFPVNLTEAELDRLAEHRSLPSRIVCGNGPEFTGKAMFSWTQKSGVKLHFIAPGKPTQNAFVKSFNGKSRKYCLEEARTIIDSWRDHYKHVRPYRSPGKSPPAVFAREAA